MDHKWLEDFLVLARERSFSRSAELRHVTQPQFSRRIRALELWAGTDLVNRSSVPLSLTPAGEELLAAARRAVTSLAEARAHIREGIHRGGWITLATGRTLSRTAVPEWFERMRDKVDGLQLRLVTGSIHEGATALEQGSVDFLLTYAHPRLALVIDDRDFESLHFGADELVPVSAPTRGGGPLHALPGTPSRPVAFLQYAPTLALHQVLQDGLLRLPEMHLAPVVESDFAESLHEQALRGAGVAWLPRALVHQDLAVGRLVPATPEAAPIRLDIRLYRSRTPRNELAARVWRASLRD